MQPAKKLQYFLGNSRSLRWVDSKLLINSENDIPEPIFIIGAPRVGSTFLFQALIARYQFTHLTNLHSLFFRQPCLAEYMANILRFIGLRHSPHFQSKYGYTPGLLAPSEAGPTFRFWFGEADHLLGSHVTDSTRIQQTVATLTKMSGGPFLSKNLFNSMRLQEILKCFPKAFLIWIQRDHDTTVRSIIKMRQDLHGNIEKWASVQVPRQEEIMQLEPKEQVQRQIKAIETYIDGIFSGRDQRFNFTVSYEALCTDPNQTITAISTAYSSTTRVKLTKTTYSCKTEPNLSLEL